MIAVVDTSIVICLAVARYCIGNALALEGGRYNTSSIARTLASREETLNLCMHKRLWVTRYAHRCRGARLYAYHDSLVRDKALHLTPEGGYAAA